MTSHTDQSQKAPRLVTQSIIRVLIVGAIWQTGADMALAQIGFGSPNDRPTFSPYLNLFRRGDRNSTVLNYYGLVRPQNRAIQQNQVINRGLYNLRQQNEQGNRLGQRPVPRFSQMGITGHPTAFMTIGGGVAGSLSGGGAGFSPIGGSFANDGVGLGVDVGAIGGGTSIGTGVSGVGGINNIPGANAIGGASAGGAGFGTGFSGTGLPTGYGGYGLGTVTGHPATYGVGGGTAFGNQ